MSYETLRYESSDSIATLTLAIPEKRNALSARLVSELTAALNQAESDSARVRAVILTGSGKAFCAGMDLSELQLLATATREKNISDARRISALFYRMYSFPRPVIAAVNGAAVAGGCGLATVADFTLAVPEAKFGYPEVKLGFMAALVAVFLRRQVGEKHARDLLFTGRLADAAEAYRMGLVTEVVPAERLMDRARELAAALAAASPSAIARTKKFLLDFDEAAIRSEVDAAIEANAAIRSTPDFREGIAAFLEKRQPKWSGE